MMTARVPILALIAGTAAISTAQAGGEIVIAARESAAAVTPRPAADRLVNLPALDVALHAAIQCEGKPVSLTVSIADTFETLGEDALLGQRAAEITLEVPAQQVALAAASPFCVAGEGESADELLVPGLVSAHASLQCANGEGRSVHYASTALQVRITCEREPPQEPPAELPAER